MTYLDHAATTPMLPESIEAMTAHLGIVGNPSSLHGAGRRARRLVEESREALAEAVGARPSEVVFTGGGTEANNLAIKGVYWARLAAEPGRRRVLASPVEHHAVLDPVRWLAAEHGARIDWLPVDQHGRVRPDGLRAAIEADPDSVTLISVMWANNEVGTIEPIAELAAIAREHGIPIHSDAVQAIGALPVDFGACALDAMTLTGHKLGGPLGVGALVLGRTTQPAPLIHGGGQERDVRSGTLDAPAIIGLATAARIAVERQEAESIRLAALRDKLISGVLAEVPDAVLNGDPGEREGRRLPGNAHLSFPGCEGDSLLLLLDARGIECSTGSACSAGVAQPSHVLLAMGAGDELARGSLRFSLGHTSTADDVEALVAAIGPVVRRARAAGLTTKARG